MAPGPSPAMTASVSPSTRDVTRYLTAGRLVIYRFPSHIFNSRDESDEENCRMLVIRDNYNKKISPFGYNYIENFIIPVNVKISITIMDILSIREVDMVYVMKIRFLMEWYDYRWGGQTSNKTQNIVSSD